MPISHDRSSVLRRAVAESDRPAAGVGDLVEVCGSVEAVEDLDAEPRVSASLDRTAIPADDQPLVEELLRHIEPVIAERLDDEYRGVLRHLVALAAASPQRPLRRRVKIERLAAALVFVALRLNDDIGRRQRWVGADVWWWFGVSDCGNVVRHLLDGLGLRRPERLPYYDDDPDTAVYAGSVSLLHARMRRKLIDRREQAIDVLEQMEEQREARRKVVPRPGGKVEIRATQARPLGVVKNVSRDGRATVVMLLGDSIDDPDDVLGFTIPDARDLLRSLQRALDVPLTVP